jgi:hypothetical protein
MNRNEQSNRSSHISSTSTEDACADAVERILEAVPAILDAMIEKAKGGSQQHAKFLFDWAKLDATFSNEEEESSCPSLAQILLDRLREDTGESASASTTDVL